MNIVEEHNRKIDLARINRLCAYERIVKDARKALQAIADCDEGNLARYCAKVDGIALDALISLDIALEDIGGKQ